MNWQQKVNKMMDLQVQSLELIRERAKLQNELQVDPDFINWCDLKGDSTMALLDDLSREVSEPLRRTETLQAHIAEVGAMGRLEEVDNPAHPFEGQL